MDRVKERRQYPLFESMADELRRAFCDAGAVFREQPQLYFNLLMSGTKHIQRNFSWNRAALDCVRHVVQ